MLNISALKSSKSNRSKNNRDGNWDRIWSNLAELGLELGVDIVESATEVGKLPASFIGDEKLGHSFPVDVLSSLECYIHHFLPCSAHFLGDFLASQTRFWFFFFWDRHQFSRPFSSITSSLPCLGLFMGRAITLHHGLGPFVFCQTHEVFTFILKTMQPYKGLA